ncbi:MAG: hypothetical protein ABIJ21_06280 [Nanoarchaeota archaeon]
MKLLQAVSIVLIIIVLLNFILFIIGRINATSFWTVLIIIGIATYALKYARRKV